VAETYVNEDVLWPQEIKDTKKAKNIYIWVN
jgi:hypothetical protein